MTEHPNVEVVRRGYEAFIQGDIDIVRSLMADDIEWTVLGNNPTSGTYRGKAEVVTYFGKIVMETEGTLELILEHIVGDAEHVVAIGRVKAQRGEKTIDAPVIQIFDMNQIGKARRVTGPFSDNSAAIDEFWS